MNTNAISAKVKENTETTTTATEKRAKVILRKPAGNREGQGWAGEVINPNGTRFFVPERFKEEWTSEELSMTKLFNIVKAIADATNYAAINNLEVSAIIKTHGVACLQSWDAYTKAVDARRDAKRKLTGTKEEVRAKWDAVKGPYNSKVRVAQFNMGLLTERILQGEPTKAIG